MAPDLINKNVKENDMSLLCQVLGGQFMLLYVPLLLLSQSNIPKDIVYKQGTGDLCYLCVLN